MSDDINTLLTLTRGIAEQEKQRAAERAQSVEVARQRLRETGLADLIYVADGNFHLARRDASRKGTGQKQREIVLAAAKARYDALVQAARFALNTEPVVHDIVHAFDVTDAIHAEVEAIKADEDRRAHAGRVARVNAY